MLSSILACFFPDPSLLQPFWFPIELVDYACKEYVKHCVYQKFPQIAELIQYIEPELKEKRIELTFYQNVLKDREKPNVRYDNPKYNKDTSSHIKDVLPSINKGTWYGNNKFNKSTPTYCRSY